MRVCYVRLCACGILCSKPSVFWTSLLLSSFAQIIVRAVTPTVTLPRESSRSRSRRSHALQSHGLQSHWASLRGSGRAPPLPPARHHAIYTNHLSLLTLNHAVTWISPSSRAHACVRTCVVYIRGLISTHPKTSTPISFKPANSSASRTRDIRLYHRRGPTSHGYPAAPPTTSSRKHPGIFVAGTREPRGGGRCGDHSTHGQGFRAEPPLPGYGHPSNRAAPAAPAPPWPFPPRVRR